MDHNTENVINEIVKRRPGRPNFFTSEEQKEKMKISSQRHYQKVCEQRKEDVRLYYIENRDAIRERKRLHYLRQKAEQQNLVNQIRNTFFFDLWNYLFFILNKYFIYNIKKTTT